MSWCKVCGGYDDPKAAIRHLLAVAKRRGHQDSAYGRAVASMVPFYERALAALEEGSATWSEYLRSISARSRLEELGGAPPSKATQDATLAENLDAVSERVERERT